MSISNDVCGEFSLLEGGNLMTNTICSLYKLMTLFCGNELKSYNRFLKLFVHTKHDRINIYMNRYPCKTLDVTCQRENIESSNAWEIRWLPLWYLIVFSHSRWCIHCINLQNVMHVFDDISFISMYIPKSFQIVP